MRINIDDLVRYYSKQGPVVLLESQSLEHPASTATYLAACPKATIKAWNSTIEIRDEDEVHSFTGNPWDALSQFRNEQNDWLFGYLGYDLKNHIEKLHSTNEDVLGAPDLYFMVPQVLLKWDQSNGRPVAIKGSLPKDVPQTTGPENAQAGKLKSTVSKSEYLQMIGCARHEIFEGNYYEVNLSHQLRAGFEGSPYALYRQMREVGPVPFASFLQFDEYAVCSLSPERFLRKRDDIVFSQPIKGTIKRDSNRGQDRKLRQHLMDSAKERAENLMIVDLVRNDLSRIAKEGSVEVSKLFEIQTFGTVHQMVSTVQATPVVHDSIEIIKACYPMGSMTGAPKIAAMKSIEALENYRRGIYSGSIGYIAPGGDFDFNVVIRTAIIKNDLLCYAVGGAITGDSDPEAEWDETWLKAEALTQALDQ